MKGFFGKMFGKEAEVEKAPIAAAPSSAGGATPKIIFDPDLAEWTTTLYENLRNYSEPLGRILDCYAARDFRGISKIFAEIGGFVDGFMTSSVLLMASLNLRAGNRDGFNTFKALGDDDFYLRDFLKVLSGEMSIENFSDRYEAQQDSELTMCIGCYEAAVYQQCRKEYAKAEELLGRCLSLRQPTVESYLAWCDLIEIDSASRKRT